MILVPDSTGLSFPYCFIETPMSFLKCVLSINIGICKGFVECWLIHLVQDFQDWGPLDFHVQLWRCCLREEACLSFHELMIFWAFVRLGWVVAETGVRRVVLLAVHWWIWLVRCQEVEVVGSLKRVKATKRILLQSIFRYTLHCNLALNVSFPNNIDWS